MSCLFGTQILILLKEGDRYEYFTTLDRNRLTPYTVGFDSLFDRLFDTDFHTTSGGFPPYNIVKNDDYNYQIEMDIWLVIPKKTLILN